jgi:APA family basic amino acid/polyamine antiporter
MLASKGQVVFDPRQTRIDATVLKAHSIPPHRLPIKILSKTKPVNNASRSTYPALKRNLSLPLITAYGLGTIIGAGIYVLIGQVAGKAAMYAPVAFALAGLIAGFTAFSYAELSARYPLSAGEARYAEEAFHRPWLSALVGASVVLIGIVSSATLANGFVGYLRLFIQLPDWAASSLLLAGLGMLAAWGISESVWAAAVVTLLELLGLLMVLVLAGGSLAELPHRWHELIPPAHIDPWVGIFLGAFLAFYAFIGFEDMVNVAEEVKRPERNLPLAIMLALSIASVLYILVALTAVLAVSPDVLSRSDAPLALVIEQGGKASPVSIGLISLLAVTNGALIQIIMASRVLYGMARQGIAPGTLGRVSARTRTPVFATVVVTLTAVGFALWLPLVRLAQITSFITLLVFALMNLALWRIKRRVPHPPTITRYPLWVPAIGFALCIGLVILQIG